MKHGKNLTAGSEDGDRGRRLGAALGGAAVKGRKPPDVCPVCGKPMAGRSWHSYLGHLGAHKTAEKWGIGDPSDLYRYLLAKYQDPYPENGAFSQWMALEVHERGG